MTGPVSDQALLVAEDIKALRNSISHLESSVTELRDAQATDPDPVYKEAIEVLTLPTRPHVTLPLQTTAINLVYGAQENIVAISKQRARLAALESQAQLIAPPQKPR